MGNIKQGDIIRIKMLNTKKEMVVNVVGAYELFIIILEGFWLAKGEFELIEVLRTQEDFDNIIQTLKKNDNIEVEIITYDGREDAKFVVFETSKLQVKRISSSVIRRRNKDIYLKNGIICEQNRIVSIKKVV